MATIKPFSAIRPNPALELSAGESVIIQYDDHQLNLKAELEGVARVRPETAEGQQAAYVQIANTLNSALKQGLLLPCPRPYIYIYETTTNGRTQTGVWCLTEKTGIKLHERTLDDSVRRLRNYHNATGLQGSPILLTYAPDETINRLIAAATSGPSMTIGNHRVWKVESDEIVKAFEKIDQVYLADGHHRLESTCEEITAIYMAADQLQLSAFHRVVQSDIEPQNLLNQLRQHFNIEPSGTFYPAGPGRFGLYIKGLWFKLKHHAAGLDAQILQDLVLAPIFGIEDPANDARLKCTGTVPANADIVFTLAPLSIDDIIRVADAGEILPPKSSYIEPKIP